MFSKLSTLTALRLGNVTSPPSGGIASHPAEQASIAASAVPVPESTPSSAGERSRRIQESDSARLRLFNNLSSPPTYVRGRMSRLHMLESKDWRAVKNELKQAWISRQWQGMVSSESAEQAVQHAAGELRNRIDNPDASFTVPERLRTKAHAYIDRKTTSPSYHSEARGAIFLCKGTDLAADIIRSDNNQFFREVTDNKKKLRQRVQREQQVRANVGKKLGQGDFGEVRIFEHLAEDGAKLVAAKIPKLRNANGDRIRNNSIEHEYNILTRLGSEPGFSELRDFARIGELDYLFMDLQIRGGLDKVLNELRRRADLTNEQKSIIVRSLAQQMIEALSSMHAAGLKHRDFKPANLLMSKRGHVVVSDFGLATDEEKVHVPVGTREIWPPEAYDRQRRGNANNVDFDKYALGFTLQLFAQCLQEPAASPLTDIAQELMADDPSNRPDLSRILELAYFTETTYPEGQLIEMIDGERRRERGEET
jgi:hypothetical protein